MTDRQPVKDAIAALTEAIVSDPVGRGDRVGKATEQLVAAAYRAGWDECDEEYKAAFARLPGAVAHD